MCVCVLAVNAPSDSICISGHVSGQLTQLKALAGGGSGGS